MQESAAAGKPPETDLARNLRAIEHVKAELAAALAGVYRAVLRASDEGIADALATLVVTAYLLGRRLGISPTRLDMKAESRLRAMTEQGHELEQWYGDFSALYRHFQGGGRP
ncbi:MAG: MazG-like family protein [Limnochordaceae bacterium]|nr:MazG-like family protein [Limnochordaceae bacterium]